MGLWQNVPCCAALCHAVQEVDAFGGRELGYADLASCPYIEAVFQESMRLYPPVSALLALVRAMRTWVGHNSISPVLYLDCVAMSLSK
jgi:cytochrome P450